MKRRAWIALAMAPLWLFALRFAWLWAGFAADHLWDRVTAPAEVAEATSEPSLSGTDAAVPDWARAQKPPPPAWLKDEPAPNPEGKGPTLVPVEGDPYAGFRPAAPAPVVGQPRKRDMERHGPKGTPVDYDPFKGEHHRPEGTPVDYDPFKGAADRHGSVAETLRAAEASRSKRTADQPPSGDPSP